MHQNKDLSLKQKINVNVTFIMLRLFHLNLQNSHRVSWRILINLVKFEYWCTVFIKF